MSRLTLEYRASVVARVIAAVAGGYLLTAQLVAVLAVSLPLELAEATLTATMLSFAIYAGIVLWVFATRSAWRMALCMAGAIAILRALLWAREAAGWG